MIRVALLVLLLPAAGLAQVPPHLSWRTFETEHFRVTFTPELEEVARRAGARAEEAYAALSRYLRPPRGKVDIVVTDHVDYSNGYATPFPSNRIVLFANPPITSSSLRFVDDPTELIVTHELLHIFQLDRAGGLWKIGQAVFGRAPYLFPNAYQPSWLLEGMAVHYETRITGSGRLAGTNHRMIARTAAMSHTLPRLDQLSLANPRFPYGYATYAYGSLFVEHLADTHGDSALARFISASSSNLVPMWLNWPARRAFRKTLTRAYREWTRSLVDSAPPHRPPMRGWQDLTVEGAYANFPRWVDDTTLLYAGTSGRETYGLYRLTLRDGDHRPSDASKVRLARRHSESPNVVLPDGSILYSQLEYSDPYHLRSDLYVDRPGGGTVRLTRGARLTTPDAREDGRIVAVQTFAAGTRLVLVSRDGRVITPLTRGSMDEHWVEPRWSPDGTRIAAIRWVSGGTSSVVVLDTAGRHLPPLFAARAVVATPSWSRDGRHVYFSSDHSGIANLYRAEVDAGGVARVSDAATGLFEPQPSPDDRRLAAVVFRADGYHVGVAPLVADSMRQMADSLPPAADSLPPTERGQGTALSPRPSAVYSPWRSLLPRYWIPFWESALSENSFRLGAFTSGEDLVGRHAYQALLYVPTDNSGITGSLYYRNASLGQPLVELVGSQDWENYRCIVDPDQPSQCAGTLRRRIRDASLSLTRRRPRVRTFGYVSLGAGVEARDYAADPAPLLAGIDSVFRGSYSYPRVVASAGWSNTQYPPLAISPEDGVALATTSRYRWRTGGSGAGTLSVVGAASAFKSIDLPGFAHHVAAVRVAGGAVDERGTGYLEVGGVSGGTIDLAPGYVLGEGRRTFGVRGFPAASLLGMRALSGSVEYRAPLLLPGRGLGTLPLFLDRTSVTLFGDAGTAWCPGIYPLRTVPDSSLCTQRDYDFGRTVAPELQPFVFRNPPVIGSVGGELNVDAAILSWDAPFRYRFGAAVPMVGKATVPAKTATFYMTVGASF